MGINEILSSLNDQQKQAVIQTEGYVRVIAGAGSGKIRALTARYAYLVEELDDVGRPEVRGKIAALLKSAHENEIRAVEIMSV